MKQVLKRLILSLALLLAAALTLLLSDLGSRQGARAGAAGAAAKLQVAVVKHASNRLLDDVESGVLARLVEAQLKEGARFEVRRFNAEGDFGTANAIGKQVTDGSFKMVVTISTLSLQSVANANRDGRTIHVFGAVTDPVGTGVGIQKMNSTNKPPWMAGIGTFQPVEQIFREAKRMCPDLKVVGTIWNPSEHNSEACVGKAREVCATLGIQLLEANVDQSKDVREAAQSLVARGIQAFWTGVDVTVLNATAAQCEVAAKARVAVFSNTSGHVHEGSLFDLGANYFEVGQQAAGLASAILNGLNPAAVVITNFMPERVMLNRQTLKRLGGAWRFPDDLAARAEVIIGEDGTTEKEPAKPAAARARPLDKTWRIQQISYSESIMVEDAMRGVKDGLKAAGLAEGSDYKLKALCAQGDMATLGALFDTAKTTGVDLYVVYSTPALQTALKKAAGTPVIFTVVADPFLAGAGKSDHDHLPNVTGIYTLGPYREMAEMLSTYFPQFKRVGTLFCPAEANSVANKDLFTREAALKGITVEAVPVNTSGDMPDAAQAMCGRPIDAVMQVIDNLTTSGFPSIARAAAQARKPFFTCQGTAMKYGAVLALSRDYYEAGRETAAQAARVMRGESASQIPFSPPSAIQKLVNLKRAQDCQLVIPEALLRQMKTVDEGKP